MGRPKGPGVMKTWLAVARDEQLNEKNAYEECAHQCIMHGLRVPERQAIYALNEESDAQHVCSVLDARMKEGLFNGRDRLSIGPGTDSTRSGAGSVRDEHAAGRDKHSFGGALCR